MDTKKLKPADIILTKGTTLYSRIIFFILNMCQSDRVRFQHSILVKNQEILIEALEEIRYTNFLEREKDFKNYIILRNKNLTDKERDTIVKKAEVLIGLKYSYFRLFLQFLDQIFHTNVFTKHCKSNTNQICSTVVSWSYHSVTKIEFNNINWQSCDPDDIDDEFKKHSNDWIIIHKK